MDVLLLNLSEGKGTLDKLQAILESRGINCITVNSERDAKTKVKSSLFCATVIISAGTKVTENEENFIRWLMVKAFRQIGILYVLGNWPKKPANLHQVEVFPNNEAGMRALAQQAEC